MEKDCLYFERNAEDIWALARIDKKLLREIQDSPLWQEETIRDYPLTEEEMISLVKGYKPNWECRYAPFLLGGWIYITRSGWWLKKLRYKKGEDDFYHVVEHYTTEQERGRDLLMEVLREGYFEPSIWNDRLERLI